MEWGINGETCVRERVHMCERSDDWEDMRAYALG